MDGQLLIILALVLVMIKLKFDVRRLDRRIDRLVCNRT
jgi:hypothetical protein